MKKQVNIRRLAAVLAAVMLICALSVTAFAYSDRIIQLLSGGTMQTGTTGDGGSYVSTTIGYDDENVPVVTGEDGRLYFVGNGEEIDITDECSYTEPFIYEFVDEDGLRRAFVAGGNPGEIGWAEYVWDEDNSVIGGSASFGNNKGSEDAPWLDAALDILGLPW